MLQNGGAGHFALRGKQEVTINKLVHMTEKALGQEQGKTQASWVDPLALFEELLTGLSVPKNLNLLVKHCEEEAPVSGPCFWEASGVQQAHDVTSHFANLHITQESLELPSSGDYRLPHLNF